ncbi:DUF4407 domain-containing protein [Nibribacter koreensis]|uniref:DUF4407 domain-containing protein n=1 Tax=Nibribacter koreensis TaxID=1084519 RepID=A0ABP8FDU6_9BACT
MIKDYYQTPKSTALMRFFWQAAGGDRYILEKATYSDQIKYMCLGGIVVATGALAAIAGGYAFYTIFEPKGSALAAIQTVSSIGGEYQKAHLPTVFLSIIFGAIWGLIIFNIDRFIVTSTGKGDGTEAITFQELKSALPRIIMGAIIALTISKPVEIRMFKSEIDIALHKEQIRVKTEYLNEIDKNFTLKAKEIDNKIGETNQRIGDLQSQYKVLQGEYVKETTGIRAGVGPIAESIALQQKSIENELNRIIASDEYKTAKAAKEQLLTEKQKAIKEADKVAAGLDGLLERIKLSHEIAGFWISFFITLLFMAIELTPIFFKLMLTKTPYDYIEENIKELMKAEQGIYIQYNYFPDKSGQERDLVIHLNKEKIINEKKSLQEVQQNLSQYAIKKYEEQMMRKIDANPEEFIKSEEPVEILSEEPAEFLNEN